jgi:hypothetical protein
VIDLERFKSHVQFLDDSDNSCWIWVGYTRDDGRGRVKANGRYLLAHRVAWELLHGRRIPAKLRLRQECSNPQCVRHWRLDKPWIKLSSEAREAIRTSREASHVLATRFGVSRSRIKQLRREWHDSLGYTQGGRSCAR